MNTMIKSIVIKQHPLAIDDDELLINKKLAYLEKKFNDERILPEQQMVLRDYYMRRIMNNSKIKSVHSRVNMIYVLHRLALNIKKPFGLMTSDDLLDYLASIKQARKSENFINNNKVIISRFMRSIGKEEEVKGKEFRAGKPVSRLLKPNDLISKDDVIKLINGCQGDIKKECIIAMLYDLGIRAGELCNIKIKDIEMKDNYAYVTVTGKTGTRRVVIPFAYIYLKNWLQIHPYRDNKESWLFIYTTKKNCLGRKMTDNALWFIVQRTALFNAFDKKIYPHLFRHSDATEKGNNGWNECDLRIRYGWTRNSKMPSIYLHRDEDDVNNKALIEAGITIEHKINSTEPLKNKTCPECNALNPITNIFCKCGTMITQEGMDSYKEKKKELEEKEAKAMIMMQRLEEMMKELEQLKKQS